MSGMNKYDYDRKITVAEIMSYNPCSDYTKSLVSGLVGDGLTLAEILDAPITDKDKLWLVLRPEIIVTSDLHYLACTFAERVAYLNTDQRVQAAIDAKRAWLRGEISDDVLSSASRSAARVTLDANVAAFAAAYADSSAADSADSSRAARAARAAQVQDIRNMLKGKEAQE